MCVFFCLNFRPYGALDFLLAQAKTVILWYVFSVPRIQYVEGLSQECGVFDRDETEFSVSPSSSDDKDNCCPKIVDATMPFHDLQGRCFFSFTSQASILGITS